mmetsp:Transcript_76328/g.210693  ORF Transcript_76328/g.210693 Transcript_76328/m.210693 type:complete len:99 (+) Transcript_76328:239-535(+)
MLHRGMSARSPRHRRRRPPRAQAVMAALKLTPSGLSLARVSSVKSVRDFLHNAQQPHSVIAALYTPVLHTTLRHDISDNNPNPNCHCAPKVQAWIAML